MTLGSPLARFTYCRAQGLGSGKSPPVTRVLSPRYPVVVIETFNIFWRDVGCPIEPGTYIFAGKSIRVRQINIEEAVGNAEAVCTVMGVTPPVGATKYYLLGTTEA